MELIFGEYKISTMDWLCDGIIDEQYRGKGLGKKTNCALNPKKEIFGVLATRDAHGLGYMKNMGSHGPEKYIIRNPD